jgi:PAS domain S-box-containing protein
MGGAETDLRETWTELLDALTSREREVLLRAMTGSHNKQIAYQRKLRENTVKQACQRSKRDLWSSWRVWRTSSKFPVEGAKRFNGRVGGSIAQKRARRTEPFLEPANRCMRDGYMEQRQQTVGHPEVAADLTEQELVKRKDFLEFRNEDVANLVGINDLAQHYAESVIEDFYKHLLSYDETKVFFRDPEVLRRVKNAQQQYFLRLTQGNYDLAYAQNRLLIGAVHERANLPIKAYLGMYNYYLRAVANRLIEAFRNEPQRAWSSFLSLMKLTFLDIGLTIDTYINSRERTIRHQREAIQLRTAELQEEVAHRRRSEIYLADAQRLSLTGSFGWRPSSGEIQWSDESYRIFEFDRTVKPTVELVLQRVHPDDRALVIQAIGETSRGEKDFNLTNRLLMPDGSIKYVHVLSHAVKDAAGNLEVIGAVTDITEQHRAELELSRLAAIVSSSDDAIISKTLGGKITSWNTAAAKIFGYEADEMIGQPITRIIPSELHQEEAQIMTRLQQGGRFSHYETVRVAKDGRRVDVSLTISPLFDKSGKVVGAAKIARDITAARRAEAELRETRTELVRVARVSTLGELAAAISHEVNQPLTGLVSSGNACLRWLSAETPDLSAARRSVERMIRDATRAGEVINRIRAMVKKAPPQRDSLNINDTIMEVMALVLAEVRRNGVSAHAALSNDLPPVLGDRIQLQQVVLNLIINAIEAMSEVDQMQRRLSISSMRDEQNGVLVAVSDSGTGLEPASLDRIFEAFYTTKVDGMGMGLAVSQKIVQGHGGRLWASPNLPRGATFQFRLPADGEQGS